ncbi:hypothetical protein F511_47447 [Dorcoceras hygrometricum]|uniref:Uncharacterized protein n=1 Tax=Dorcoceras hygrometricum TaxID=472368 RepID=A0A2Z6ZXB6_9LAMI|nr:hypothetical protein F511_47447 [Dorcoceras hygrometricum]
MASLPRASGCTTLGDAARICVRMAAEACALVAHRGWTLGVFIRAWWPFADRRSSHNGRTWDAPGCVHGCQPLAHWLRMLLDDGRATLRAATRRALRGVSRLPPRDFSWWRPPLRRRFGDVLTAEFF